MNTSKQAGDSKRYTISAAVSKAQYDYVVARAKDKGLTVSDYVRGLIEVGIAEDQMQANQQSPRQGPLCS
jgi:hypothetical protein